MSSTPSTWPSTAYPRLILNWRSNDSSPPCAQRSATSQRSSSLSLANSIGRTSGRWNIAPPSLHRPIEERPPLSVPPHPCLLPPPTEGRRSPRDQGPWPPSMATVHFAPRRIGLLQLPTVKRRGCP